MALSRNDVLALVQKKYEGGAASQLDVAKARAALYDVSVAVPELEREVAQLENATSLLLGRNPGPIKRGTILALKLPPVPAGIPSDILDRKEMARQTQQLVDTLDVRIPSAKAVLSDLSGGQRQGVAISRATHWATGLVLMDEPTAALGVAETAKVEEPIRRLKERGSAILIVSHNMEQVFRLADEGDDGGARQAGVAQDLEVV